MSRQIWEGREGAAWPSRSGCLCWGSSRCTVPGVTTLAGFTGSPYWKLTQWHELRAESNPGNKSGLQVTTLQILSYVLGRFLLWEIGHERVIYWGWRHLAYICQGSLWPLWREQAVGAKWGWKDQSGGHCSRSDNRWWLWRWRAHGVCWSLMMEQAGLAGILEAGVIKLRGRIQEMI